MPISKQCTCNEIITAVGKIQLNIGASTEADQFNVITQSKLQTLFIWIVIIPVMALLIFLVSH